MQQAKSVLLTEAEQKFKRGDQVACVPLHAKGDINHPDVEFGFVTSVRGDTVFCRYWSKYHDGLRTQANSEGCSSELLVHYRSKTDTQVEMKMPAPLIECYNCHMQRPDTGADCEHCGADAIPF